MNQIRLPLPITRVSLARISFSTLRLTRLAILCNRTFACVELVACHLNSGSGGIAANDASLHYQLSVCNTLQWPVQYQLDEATSR